jgi:hypothetical protein
LFVRVMTHKTEHSTQERVRQHLKRVAQPARWCAPSNSSVLLLFGTPLQPERRQVVGTQYAYPSQKQILSRRGSLPNFLGCSLDPPPPFASAIKCHQKSTSNSVGSSVGSLAPLRATPRLGGAAVSCQYFPCSFVLALRELGLRLGVKAPLPLRASSHGVLPGAGALGYGNRRLRAVCHFDAAAPKSRSRL